MQISLTKEEAKLIFNYVSYVYRDKTYNKTSITDREADRVTKKMKDFVMDPEEEKFIKNRLGDIIKQPYRLRFPGKAEVDLFFNDTSKHYQYDQDILLKNRACLSDTENKGIIFINNDMFCMDVTKDNISIVMRTYYRTFYQIICAITNDSVVTCTTISNIFASYFIYCTLEEEIVKPAIDSVVFEAIKSLGEKVQYNPPYINEDIVEYLVKKVLFIEKINRATRSTNEDS